ncbi:hypothetical protein ACFQ02_05365 [Seminibacterium arietis]|uniref:Uncharacterized protein n=1 Tax=Seminibacterium arietis TaxID=1173502 RepID=A0ABW3I8K9_9PAST
MATEKLTKKRLIQIIITLCILVAAFISRSCHDEPDRHQHTVFTEIDKKQTVKI